MSHRKVRCTRCGIDCSKGGNSTPVIICKDCRAADPWFVEHMAVAS